VVGHIDRAGLNYEVTGMDTVVEGDWDQVMPVIRDAERELRSKHDRVFLLIVADDHAGATNRIHTSVSAVEQELGRSIAR
jgi:uncharacterized protein YqgV (UPF0045/DUF77 family)